MTEDYKVYPKQYRFEKAKVIKNKCFFVMPFDEEFDMDPAVEEDLMTESETEDISFEEDMQDETDAFEEDHFEEAVDEEE